MTNSKIYRKVSYKDKDKIMYRFPTVLASVFVERAKGFCNNEAGCTGFDWNAFDSRKELAETLKYE